MHVLHLGAVVSGFVKGNVCGLLVTQRQVKAVSKTNQIGPVKLFLRVRGHLALACAAHAVTLFGVRQNHRGLAGVAGGCGVGSMDLDQIMAAALEAVNLLVGHALRQPCQLGVLAKKGVSVKAAVFGGKSLHLPVYRVGKGFGQCACGITGKEAIPVAAPDQFDNVPASPGKQLFKLVNDAAIAAHRAIKALQVAVDDPDQVVQPFTRSQRKSAHGLGLVHLAVAKHAPDLSAAAVEQPAVREVTHKARVVNRADGANAHRAGGKLPEVRHQIRVRVAAQALGTAARGR